MIASRIFILSAVLFFNVCSEYVIDSLSFDDNYDDEKNWISNNIVGNNKELQNDAANEDTTIIQKWEYCQNLQELKIENVTLNEVPSQWPENCTQLTSIRLENLETVTAEKIISVISHGCGNLKSLSIHYCNLTDIPYQIINNANKLIHLNLSHNQILDPSFSQFPVLSKLTHLDLSFNHLTGTFLAHLVEKMPALEYLSLIDNQFSHAFCDYERNTHSLSSLSSLEWLSLNQMQVPYDCFQSHHFKKLKFLGLATSDNRIDFRFPDLPSTNSTHLEVDFRGNVISKINAFATNEYKATIEGKPSGFWTPDMQSYRLYSGTNVTLRMSYLDCDCQNYWLSRALRETEQNFVKFPDVKCSQSKRKFIEEPLENMNCIKEVHNGCVYRVNGTYYTEEHKQGVATAECHKKRKVKINFHTQIIGVNISDGFISSVQNIVPLTDAIQWIDLRKNNITRFENKDTVLLFANSKRRVWLKGNPIFCDCANKPLLDALHKHKNQVIDFDELICLESGTLLKYITSYEVCQVGLHNAISVSAFIILLAIVLTFFIWRYRYPLQIYLYSKGLCLFFLRDEDDSDKKYDAFLSFAHGDEKYVTEELLPKLEAEPECYRICVHYRDWVIGDFIPVQIVRSIQESKRTIIVLSKNFLASSWASWEFKCAIANATNGGSRVLVLVLDDVFSQKMDADMQEYLSSITYMTVDDPWFWDKLRYAMPRRKQTFSKAVRASKSSEEFPLKSVSFIK